MVYWAFYLYVMLGRLCPGGDVRLGCAAWNSWCIQGAGYWSQSTQISLKYGKIKGERNWWMFVFISKINTRIRLNKSLKARMNSWNSVLIDINKNMCNMTWICIMVKNNNIAPKILASQLYFTFCPILDLTNL